MYNFHNQTFICCVCIIIYCFFDLKWFIWIPPPFEYRAAHGYPAAGSWRILWPLHSGCSSTDSAPFDKKFPVSSNASLLCIWISSCFPPIFHQFSSNFPSVFLQFSSSFLPVFLIFFHIFSLMLVQFHKKEEHELVWQDFRNVKYSSSHFLIKNDWENNFVATLWNQLRHWIWHQLWLQLQLQLLHQLWLQLQLPHQLPHQLQEQHQWIQNDFHNNIWLNMTALCFHIRLKSFFSSISQTYHLWICFFFIYVVWISIEIGKTNTFFFFAPFWSCFFMDFFKKFS